MRNRTRLIRQGALLTMVLALFSGAAIAQSFDGDDTNTPPPTNVNQDGSWEGEHSYPRPTVLHEASTDENSEYEDSLRREDHSYQSDRSNPTPSVRKFVPRQAEANNDSNLNPRDADQAIQNNDEHPDQNYVMRHYDTNADQADFSKSFSRLAEVLPLYEQAVQHPWLEIPLGGKALHPGSHNDDVMLLRARLKATHDLAADVPDSTKFDKELAAAVKVFQMRHGLNADGVVGDNTKAEMNIPASIRVAQIKLNMQRWADLAPTLGHRYLMVNIPEYQLHVIDNDKQVLTMKVVVGRPTRQTPELNSRITRIVFNPKWNVPSMIAKNDIIPKVIENPNYLTTNNIRIFNSDQENSYEVNREDVDWEDARENGFNYRFRQDAGVKNALGEVKFEFANTHDVYLHDTPAKGLFNADRRDFSSGCIRLEKPFALVDYLVQNDERINNEKINDTLASRVTTYFRVDHALPIVITYLTAWVDEQGLVHFTDDVYGRDGLIPEQYSGEDDKLPE